MRKLISILLSGSIFLCGSLPCYAEDASKYAEQATSKAVSDESKDAEQAVSNAVSDESKDAEQTASKTEEPRIKKDKKFLKITLASLFTGGLVYAVIHKLIKLSNKVSDMRFKGTFQNLVSEEKGYGSDNLYYEELVKYLRKNYKKFFTYLQKSYPNFFRDDMLTQYMPGDTTGIFSFLKAMKTIEDDKHAQLSSQLNECENERKKCELLNNLSVSQENTLNALAPLEQQVEGNGNVTLDNEDDKQIQLSSQLNEWKNESKKYEPLNNLSVNQENTLNALAPLEQQVEGNGNVTLDNEDDKQIQLSSQLNEWENESKKYEPLNNLSVNQENTALRTLRHGFQKLSFMFNEWKNESKKYEPLNNLSVNQEDTVLRKQRPLFLEILCDIGKIFLFFIFVLSFA